MNEISDPPVDPNALLALLGSTLSDLKTLDNNIVGTSANLSSRSQQFMQTADRIVKEAAASNTTKTAPPPTPNIQAPASKPTVTIVSRGPDLIIQDNGDTKTSETNCFGEEQLLFLFEQTKYCHELEKKITDIDDRFRTFNTDLKDIKNILKEIAGKIKTYNIPY
jgi:hypothetical protein